MTTPVRKKRLASYGRIKGRVIRETKRNLLNDFLPQVKFQGNISNLSPNWLEIGFGSGEHLAHRALSDTNINFIGCEVYLHGIGSLLKKIKDNSLENIRIYTDDARDLLQDLPQDSIDRIFILFPDPWPKFRHHKRRIINQETLGSLYNVMKSGSMLHIATDWPDYSGWIMVNMVTHGRFEFMANSPEEWINPPSGHIKTKYQLKAEKEGRKAVFMNFAKV